jgi:hypothetical protein
VGGGEVTAEDKVMRSMYIVDMLVDGDHFYNIFCNFLIIQYLQLGYDKYR